MSVWGLKALIAEIRVRESHFIGNGLLVEDFNVNFSIYILIKRTQNISHPLKIYIFLVKAALCFTSPLPSHLQWCDWAFWPSLCLRIFAIL